MRRTLLPFGTALLSCWLCACNEQRGSTSSRQAEEHQQIGTPEGNARPPENLDEALAMLMPNLTPERRAYIEAGGEEFAFCAIDDSVLPSDKPLLDWVPPRVPRDQPLPAYAPHSPLQRYFIRLGIYHGEDMWLIINVSLSRNVRNKPIKLEEQVAELRRYWAEQDIVAPLDLNCPHCGKEMHISFEGDKVSPVYPSRAYFFGYCPDGSVYYYYHTDGWITEDEFKKANKPEMATPRKPSD